MIVVGIDPGSVSGALGCLGTGPQMVSDLATIEGQINVPAFAAALRTLSPDVVVIERVHSMPKQGVASTFKFGASYGIILGVVGALGIPSFLVQPAVWKGHHGLGGKDNDAVRNAAVRRHPMLSASMILKKHHNRASALMIAQWFLDTKAPNWFERQETQHV
jgi:crossover junction endodeoxyribonuclease RuvC